MSWNVRELTKSSSDKMMEGICGGLGEHTPLPSWLWRVLFITFSVPGGFGLVAYIALWIFMPPANPERSQP